MSERSEHLPRCGPRRAWPGGCSSRVSQVRVRSHASTAATGPEPGLPRRIGNSTPLGSVGGVDRYELGDAERAGPADHRCQPAEIVRELDIDAVRSEAIPGRQRNPARIRRPGARTFERLNV
jgi:hypothetical protein